MMLKLFSKLLTLTKDGKGGENTPPPDITDLMDEGEGLGVNQLQFQELLRFIRSLRSRFQDAVQRSHDEGAAAPRDEFPYPGGTEEECQDEEAVNETYRNMPTADFREFNRVMGDGETEGPPDFLFSRFLAFANPNTILNLGQGIANFAADPTPTRPNEVISLFPRLLTIVILGKADLNVALQNLGAVNGLSNEISGSVQQAVDQIVTGTNVRVVPAEGFDAGAQTGLNCPEGSSVRSWLEWSQAFLGSPGRWEIGHWGVAIVAGSLLFGSPIVAKYLPQYYWSIGQKVVKNVESTLEDKLKAAKLKADKLEEEAPSEAANQADLGAGGRSDLGPESQEPEVNPLDTNIWNYDPAAEPEDVIDLTRVVWLGTNYVFGLGVFEDSGATEDLAAAMEHFIARSNEYFSSREQTKD
jgi:hypothetical protein